MPDENKRCPTEKISPLAPACSRYISETFSSRCGPGGFFILGDLNLGFTKLDEGILQSSILAEDSDIFKVWIVLMAACDENGIARISPVYISSICHLAIEKVHEALTYLQKMDPESRSQKEKGRRIKKVDGGFYLINYKDYRLRLYSKGREAERKRKWREEKKTGHERDMSQMSLNVPDGSASAYASSSSSFKEGDKGGEKAAKFAGGADDETIDSEFKDLWDNWPMKKDKVQALINYRRLRRTHEVQELVKAVKGYKAFLKSQRLKKGFDQTPLYLSTFLNKDRWKEYRDEKYIPAL